MAPTGIQPKTPHFDEEEDNLATPELSRKSISSNSSFESYENCVDSSEDDDEFLSCESDECIYCPNCGCDCCEIYDKGGKLKKFREINS